MENKINLILSYILVKESLEAKTNMYDSLLLHASKSDRFIEEEKELSNEVNELWKQKVELLEKINESIR